MSGEFLKVSIIMPTYNRAGLISETINSVLNQTYSNWELIIVDDGSTDNTENLIEQINDERIRYYKSSRIGIVGKIKNKGIEKATGELIAFIDSDDLWDKTKLAKQITALQDHPEAGFSLTGGYNFRVAGKPTEYFYKHRQGTRYDNIFIAFFNSEVAAIMPSLVLHRKCLETAGMFDVSKPFADVEFVLGLAKNFKAVILYEPLVHRRIHDANDSDSNWVKRHYEGIEMFLSYREYVPRAILSRAIFRSYINFGEKCLRHEMRRKAFDSFIIAWKQRPFHILPYKKMAKTILTYLKGK